jgi:hypothetical protein
MFSHVDCIRSIAKGSIGIYLSRFQRSAP